MFAANGPSQVFLFQQPAPNALLALEQLPHDLQFLSVVGCRLGEGHLEPLQRLQYDVGDEQSGGEFVIGWDNIPRCLRGASGG